MLLIPTQFLPVQALNPVCTEKILRVIWPGPNLGGGFVIQAVCPPATKARPLSSLHLSLCQLTIHTPGMKVHCAQGVSPSPLPGSSHTYVRQFVLNACTCRKNSSQSLVSSEAGPWMEDEVPCPLMQRRGDVGVRGHRGAGPPGQEKYRAVPWILPPAALAKIKARDTPFSLPKQVTEFQAARRPSTHPRTAHPAGSWMPEALPTAHSGNLFIPVM